MFPKELMSAHRLPVMRQLRPVHYGFPRKGGGPSYWHSKRASWAHQAVQQLMTFGGLVVWTLSFKESWTAAMSEGGQRRLDSPSTVEELRQYFFCGFERDLKDDTVHGRRQLRLIASSLVHHLHSRSSPLRLGAITFAPNPRKFRLRGSPTFATVHLLMRTRFVSNDTSSTCSLHFGACVATVECLTMKPRTLISGRSSLRRCLVVFWKAKILQ
jgi:hypothetical protein